MQKRSLPRLEDVYFAVGHTYDKLRDGLKQASSRWKPLNSARLYVIDNLPISKSGDRVPRVPLAVRVDVMHYRSRMSWECQSVNISRSGLLVRVTNLFGATLAVNDRFALQIHPDNRYLRKLLAVDGICVREDKVEKEPGNFIWLLAFSLVHPAES